MNLINNTNNLTEGELKAVLLAFDSDFKERLITSSLPAVSFEDIDCAGLYEYGKPYVKIKRDYLSIEEKLFVKYFKKVVIDTYIHEYCHYVLYQVNENYTGHNAVFATLVMVLMYRNFEDEENIHLSANLYNMQDIFNEDYYVVDFEFIIKAYIHFMNSDLTVENLAKEIIKEFEIFNGWST